MATEIKVWQIINETLQPIETSMVEEKRLEKDLENWIKTHPEILGENILIIGEQVSTNAGVIDFLGIDASGDLIIIELKRDKLGRDALAQAIDYASEVASWTKEDINERINQNLENLLNDKNFQLQDSSINENQKILLVGFSMEDRLQRMIEWLSENYGMSINAVLLKYIKTKNGEELIARAMVIPEEIEKERTEKQKMQKKIQKSDEPGNYSEDELKKRLLNYLSKDEPVPKRIRRILLPLCLEYPIVTREMIKQELLKRGEAENESQAKTYITHISNVIDRKERDYLRQILRYDRITVDQKENYRIPEEYKQLVKDILSELNKE
jgi:RecB family endonuclease NucS